MREQKVGFVGGGNMSAAIAGGLLASGKPAGHIRIAEPDQGRRRWLRESIPGIAISGDNAEVASAVDCVVLAVKPDVVRPVCEALAGRLGASKPLFISIAAGVRSPLIASWLGEGAAIVRVMPNQPALLQQGVSALYAGADVDQPARELAQAIMAAVGTVVWVERESDLDAVTAISGSGPAYFFLLIDMMIKTAVELGLEPAAARSLAIGTASGAAALAAGADDSMDELIARVRSPGGTTAAALDSLEKQNVRDIFSAALAAARDRAAAMALEAEK